MAMNMFEDIIYTNVPNVGGKKKKKKKKKKTITEVPELHRDLQRMKTRRNRLRQILKKLAKIEDKEMLKNNDGKATNYIQGDSHMVHLIFSAETSEVRRVWHNICKMM